MNLSMAGIMLNQMKTKTQKKLRDETGHEDLELKQIALCLDFTDKEMKIKNILCMSNYGKHEMSEL